MPFQGTLFCLTDEERMIQDTVAEFAQKDLVPLDKKAALLSEFSQQHFKKVWNRVAQAGLSGITIPEEYGGQPVSSRAFALFMQEFCRVMPDIGLSVGVNVSLVGFPLVTFGTSAQKAKWLPGIASGECIGCYCQTEPSAGSDVSAIRTTATQSTDGWRISGQKLFITNGSEADFFLVLARTGPHPYRDLTWFIVDGSACSLEHIPERRNEHKAGLHQSPTTALTFMDCPAQEVLGEIGDGWKIAMATLGQSRPTLIAGQALGVMLGVLDAVRPYLASRRQFSMALEELSVQRDRLLRMDALRLMSELLAWDACRAKDNAERLADSRPFALEGSLAKLFSTEAAEEIASQAKNAMGGMGYMVEARVARFWQDSGVLCLYEGTSEIQKKVILRELVRRGSVETLRARVRARGIVELRDVLKNLVSCSTLRDSEVLFDRTFAAADERFGPVEDACSNANTPLPWFAIVAAYTALRAARLVWQRYAWLDERATSNDKAIAGEALRHAKTAVFRAALQVDDLSRDETYRKALSL